ncbi:phage tail protein [Erythrobacter sp.]|uniref:phage tail protein n=1 Tax=Erythrobacter sp. TaxID=1042 RepID=UPI001425FD48|nr:phage tail protein [Erythrobacter sp.]QIQ87694.1 MAG: hypothetical protein G9473_14120 [Erythrobacter sp.]
MATLVLTALGTALGGPVGGAIGALIGRQADQAVLGGGNRTGPRLKELAVTTSSYGTPIPRQFGRMRTAGTIIWATDLVESKSTEGGGKGKPSTTTFSYSASFAVAVSSTPIREVRRVWADGKLLRGAAGDLKIEGTMRTHRGFGDDPVDPLIAADRGIEVPGFRDLAYVVFEDLQLADFGNRIPALTFEVIGEEESSVRLDRILPQAAMENDDLLVPHARGLADEGGPIATTLAAIDRVYPLAISLAGDRLHLSARAKIPADAPVLAEQLASQERGREADRREHRGETLDLEPVALRYYDEARDYQPGVQRSSGARAQGRENVLDLPATLSANDAKLLVNACAHRARWSNQRLSWLCSELDPDLRPGGVVRLPDQPGSWLVRSWEWHESGIELGLERLAPDLSNQPQGDPGYASPAEDLPISKTVLDVFELPPAGPSRLDAPTMFAAAAASNAAWRGATLFIEQGQSLIEIGKTGSMRATTGELAQQLEPGGVHVLERRASLEVEICSEDGLFPSTDLIGLATGANRLLVGGEVLQYLYAERVGPTRWTLSGLLRGRAGTEHLAQGSHPTGCPVALLDETLVSLDPTRVGSNPNTRIAAIGRGDPEPVFATLRNAGSSRRPLPPVHPSLSIASDSSWSFTWTRRARGQWQWADWVDVPLVEEGERYLVGYGRTDTPFASWLTQTPAIAFSLAERSALVSAHGPADLWVKQVGTYSHSQPLLLGRIS